MDVEDGRREQESLPAPQYGGWLVEVRRYVHRLTGDADLADDIAQEAVVRLFYATDGPAIRSPRAWLFRTATNLVRDSARREAIRNRHSVVPEATQDTPGDELERKDTIRQVREALQRIPERDRQLLILRESGFPYREIADVIGVKTESVPVLVSRALARFRTAYTAGAGR
jgi:RNA polymerase sigma factor (sigma-70 family)